MRTAIRMPDLGTVEGQVVLLRWLKTEGDTVAVGEPLFEVETDKGVSEVESALAGVLERRLLAEGARAGPGETIAYISERSAAPREAAGAEVSGQGRDWKLELYRKMVLIRQFEERVKLLFLEGVMPGTIHQYQGQEACAVGVCAALGPDDVVTSTHRPHGHCIAKGMPVDSMMAELFGKATGCCKGKGGSMHMGDLSRGVVPAVAIVGGALPLAAGIGLSFRMRKEKRVVAAFMGDGATNEGAFHEALNMASIWDLPVVWVVENNFYGASTHVKMVMKAEHIADRASAYGIPGRTADGNDVMAVFQAAEEAVARARSGGGPTLLELETYRITGHSRRDPCLYQPAEERKRALANEPLGRFEKTLLAAGIAGQEDLEAVRRQARAEIEAAVEKAMADPEPAPEEALEDLWV
jgi:TPP-dependent pyruvate/acetoin dehydrogenase alpha subunit